MESGAKVGEGGARGAANGAAKKAARSYSYLLEFRCRGRLVHSEKTDDMPELASIGRSRESYWVIPPEDRSAADFSAQLRLGAREISIVAPRAASLGLRASPQASGNSPRATALQWATASSL